MIVDDRTSEAKIRGAIASLSALLAAVSYLYLPGPLEAKMSALKMTSAAFGSNASIPSKYTCDGPDLSPPLRFENVPANARSLALIVDDPDAPVGTWVHWVVWNIPPGTSGIAENSVPADVVQGTNDFRTRKYGGPCPPSGTHRYFFKLYALDTTLPLSAGSTKADLEKAMKGHILEQAELVGLYKRK